MADVVGEAIVAVKANTSGFLGDISSAVGKANGEMSKIGKVGTIATVGLTAPILAIGAVAVSSALQVDDAMDKIVQATGATGGEVGKLKESFKNVFTSVPASASTVAEAMGMISTRTGLTGTALEDMTKKMVLLSQWSGTDAKTMSAQLTRVFGDWSISTENQGLAMDKLWVVSQKTGIGMGELSKTIVQYGAPLRQLGVGFDDAAIMLGKWSKEGVNVTTVLSAMRKSVGYFAKEGIDPMKGFADTIKGVKSGAIDTSKAMEIFGTKAGPDMVAAIKEGRFNLEDYTKAVKNAGGAINTTAENTMGFDEKLTMMKNKLTVAFEPLGVAILNIGEKLMPIAERILGFVTNLANKFGTLPAPIQMVIVVIGGILAAIGPVLMVVDKLHGTFTRMLGVVGKLAPKIAGVLAGGGGSGFDKLLQGGEKTAGGGMLSKIPLVGGLAGGGAEGGGMLAGLAGLAPLLLPVVAIVGAIAAGFAVLYATSSTFRGMISGVLTTLQNIFGWVKEIAGALMSGNFSKAGDLLKSGFEGAINSIRNFDFGEWARKMIASIKESVGMIGGIVLQGLSQLGDIAGKIADFLGNINWDSVIQGLIDAIMGMFSGGAIGGASGGVSTGMNKSLVSGATQAAPNVLAKLLPAIGKLGLELILLMPKIGLALIMALGKALIAVNWGAMRTGVQNACLTALAGLGLWVWAQLSPIPMRSFNMFLSAFASFGVWLWGKLVPIPGQLWSGITIALGTFGAWLWNLIVGLPGRLWSGITSALSTFGSWMWGMIVGLPGQLWNGITGAIGTFGSWMWGLIVGLPGQLWNGITGALGSFGSWLWDQVSGLPGRLGGEILSAVGNIGIHGSWHIPAVPVLLPGGYDVSFAEGGFVAHRPGGIHAIIGEGGEDEYVIPASKMGDFGAIAAMPQMAGGGMVSSGVVSSISSSTKTSGSGGGITFQAGAIQIIEPKLTSMNEADKIGQQIGYKATETLRRSGHTRG